LCGEVSSRLELKKRARAWSGIDMSQSKMWMVSLFLYLSISVYARCWEKTTSFAVRYKVLHIPGSSYDTGHW